MLIFKRSLQRMRRALINWQSKRLIARANAKVRRGSKTLNPGYDELRNPVFLLVMVAAALVLVVDAHRVCPWVQSIASHLIGLWTGG
jgi:hypothetical protein